MTANYSLHILAAYVVLCFVPQVIAVQTIKAHARYNNFNPRSSSNTEELKKRVPKDAYSRFERAKAAHTNSLETLPLVATALLAATFAGRPADRVNAAAVGLLLQRALYIAIYVGIDNPKYAGARSLVWILGVIASVTVLVQAANEVAFKTAAL